MRIRRANERGEKERERPANSRVRPCVRGRHREEFEKRGKRKKRAIERRREKKRDLVCVPYVYILTKVRRIEKDIQGTNETDEASRSARRCGTSVACPCERTRKRERERIRETNQKTERERERERGREEGREGVGTRERAE